MKTFATFFIVCAIMTLATSAAFGQISSNGTGGGNWNAPSTWVGNSVPTGSEVITIQATDSVYFNAQVTITGTVKTLSGKTAVFDSSKVTFASGSVYEHAANGGSLPKVTWGTGSTCLITGAAANAPSNGNQNFYNLTWNCPAQSASLNLAMINNTIGGDLRVVSTGTGLYFRLTAGGSQPTSGKKIITINGNVLVDSSFSMFTSTGSGSPNDTFSVVTKGSIISRGTFQVANGSGGMVNWFVGGNVMALGSSFTTNSGATVPDSLIFNGTQPQLFVKAGSLAAMANMKFTVRAGSTVSFDTNSIGTSSTTNFTLEPGSTMITSNIAGVNGSLTGTGVKTLSTAANYIFAGTAAQVTGTMMPATVNNLKIDNNAGVTLSQATMINGQLNLKAGQFDNTIAFTLGAGGSIANNGGTLKFPFTSVDPSAGGIPTSFSVSQNFPNPFNPSTTIVYALPSEAVVVAKVFNVLGQEVAALYDGKQPAGVHQVTFDAARLNSGLYFYRVQAGGHTIVKQMVLLK